MTQCAQKITVQLPNEFSRVGYLLDAIECHDPQLQAAMAQVRQDKTPVVGMRNNFENAVAQILPAGPVARKRSSSTKQSVLVMEGKQEESTNVSAFGDKPGKGPKTGVDLRYHTIEEYRALSYKQKGELLEWREREGLQNPSKKASQSDGNKKSKKSGKSNKSRKVRFDKKVLASVEAAIDNKLKAVKETQQQEDITKAYIQGVISEMTGKKPPQASTSSVSSLSLTAPPVPSLTQIMERVQNTSKKN